MSDERRWFEVTIVAKDARNRSHEAHVEYRTHAPDVETAAREVATELGKHLGSETVKPAGTDR